MSERVLTPAAMREALHAIGAERYHNNHPFHRMLHAGELTLGLVPPQGLRFRDPAGAPAHRRIAPRLAQPARGP